MGSLTGKVDIVTGASAPRGIGCAIAKRLAKDGASVLLTDINGQITINGTRHNKMKLLETTAEEIKANDGQALTLTLDVTQKEDVTRCVEFAKSQLSPIDILVNNAGSLAGSDNFLETTPAQWESSFQVNLLGPMMLTQAVIPEMRAAGAGSIINIGSAGSLGVDAVAYLAGPQSAYVTGISFPVAGGVPFGI